MHAFRKHGYEPTLPRIHSSPSLPNLRYPPLNQKNSCESPSQLTHSPSQRVLLGSLDLADSKVHEMPSSQGLSSLQRSPCRPPLPLTPPLTPSSSLNESLSQSGQPNTPTDADTSPTVATRWLRQPVVYLKSQDMQGYGEGRGVVSLDEPRGLELDLTPTEGDFASRPNLEERSLERDERSLLDSYSDNAAQPSRLLLVSNVPQDVSHESVKDVFSMYGDLQGIWAGKLQSHGVVMLAFYDLRHSQTAKRMMDSRDVKMVVDQIEQTIRLRSNFVFLSQVKKLIGNSSRVSEFERGAAFGIRINDRVTDPTVVQSVLGSFGQLRAFDGYHDGKSSTPSQYYVEYCDVREAAIALRDLQNKPSPLNLQFEIFSLSSISDSQNQTFSSSMVRSPASTYALDSDCHAVPFPPASPARADFLTFPTLNKETISRPRPRSASADAGDGVKAFRLEDRHRERLVDTSPEQPRRRSQHDVFDVAAATPSRQTHERSRSASHDARERRLYEPSSTPSSYPLHHPDPSTPAYYIPGPRVYSNDRDSAYMNPRYVQQSTSFPGAYGHPYGPDYIPIGPPAHPQTQTQYFIPPSPSRPQAARRGGHRERYSSPSPVHAASYLHSYTSASTRTTPLHSSRVSTSASGQSQDRSTNQIDLERIEAGLDTRTTVMIKNIPNRMSDTDLVTFIGDVCPRRIDFFYLRMDFQNGCNVGYAFVNFITVKDLLAFAQARLGTRWNMYSSEKVLQMSYANYQGKEALVEKFKNSGIMDEREAWRPKIFYSDGPRQGYPEQFPPPTHQRRKERSAHNRGALFVPGMLR
ncbi:hypothetical protein EW146_g9778 [Bondarzewia mesenterica]|uniref:RRM domain-containing protein n=1 Tax=Bondarzewia mesenterica TaxID=1095465 RepID=A0A4S4L3E3_9AGAM|nr:hypothetical protein EW146_g9778 [Bondarzewia mesenterica]